MNKFSFKSDLFITKIDLLFRRSFKNPVKKPLLGSIITILRSASSAFCKANLMPFFSISSFELLIPAVSEIITGSPLILRCTSITSLVVPAISETIAASLLER